MLSRVADWADAAAAALSDPAAGQRAAPGVRDHRPWPLPQSPWVMGQTWRSLLFAHWAVDPAALEEVVPDVLPLDTFDGRAWVGVTPFEVVGLRLRGLPPLPLVSAFGEINVRTYVTVDGKPGIFFFSLDAASALAVATARRAYRLPYFRARIAIEESSAGIVYASDRTSGDGPSASWRARYAAEGTVFHADPGTLEHFLTERYCLYTLDASARVLRGDIHHPPWPLQLATADIGRNTMGAQIGLGLDGEPLLHLARRQDVVFWPLVPVAG